MAILFTSDFNAIDKIKKEPAVREHDRFGSNPQPFINDRITTLIIASPVRIVKNRR